MQYPLSEIIGHPDLFVGRKKEFAILDKWLKLIPDRLGKSKVLFSRRKGGKTALVQRLFNRVWNENGRVIPLFFSITDKHIWLPDFAIAYYRTFASQYISFLDRNESLVEFPLTLNDILDYGKKNSIDALVRDVKFILEAKKDQFYDSMWDTACSAPKRFAAFYDIRFLVMIDEFQYLSKFITVDHQKKIPDKTMPGSYHHLSESKIAPMLITGSYANWLSSLIHIYLDGRLAPHYFKPYLAPDEGLEAVKACSRFYNQKTNRQSQQQINELCQSDPFFISCVIQSDYENKDLLTEKGVIETVNYEITHRYSGMSITWQEYIDQTLDNINSIHAKRILLYMSQNPNRVWIPRDLVQALHLDMSEREVLERLKSLEKADLIERGNANIEYKGLNDGTLHLVLRSRFGREIEDFDPDIRNDFRKTLDEMNAEIEKLKSDKDSISKEFNTLKGQYAEDRLANTFRSKKRFSLLEFFTNVFYTGRLNIVDVRTRYIFQRADGKNMEIDIKAESSCGRVVLVEVKNWKKKVGVNVIRDFVEKVTIFRRLYSNKDPLPCVWAKNGFSKNAIQMCERHGIGMATDNTIVS